MPDDRETQRVRPGQARSGPLRLVVLGERGAEIHALPETGEVVLGRGAEADVCIDEVSISRRHARLHLGESLRIEDLGSANGTVLRERRLQIGELADLAAGDALELGGTLVVVQRAEPAKAPRASDAGAMERLRKLLDRVAASDISVVLLGETGVGKSLLAAELHRKSRRGQGPFVSLNCAAVAASLLESELFGHERGAFTGADQARQGLFEAAQHGTIFLDEIGEMPIELQPKLLQVLEDRAVRRVGGTRTIPIDARVISASNRDLESQVSTNTFRADLWFRLDGIALHVPPLRERPGEIEALARSFAAQAAQGAGHEAPELSPDAIAALRRNRWPGNVRELRNAIERAVLLAGAATIGVEHLPGETAAAAPTARQLSAEDEDERRRIVGALESCAWNQGRAAAILGISRRTLVTRLGKLGLPRPRKPVR